MEKSITSIIEQLILPPGIFILLCTLGLLMATLRHGPGKSLIALGLAGLYTCSTPVVANLLARTLEHYPAIQLANFQAQPNSAIVVLGGGRDRDAPEYGGDTVSSYSLERSRYGAYLARNTKLPLLITGGIVFDAIEAEAVLMQRVIEEEMGVPVRWTESLSRTTWENARHSARLLSLAEIDHIYLVTHAGHMQRSVYAFEQHGLKVTPAPMGFKSGEMDYLLRDFLPSAGALQTSRNMGHEWVGLLWYKTKTAEPGFLEFKHEK